MYLDLGGALAAIGLVFAVYQLRQPSWDVVLQLRPPWQRFLFLTLSIVGALLTLVAVGLDHIQLGWQPAWLFTSFLYQVLAYIAFALSPTSLLILATAQRGLFSERNAARFYYVLGWHLATTDERAAALTVLLNNFSSIARTASSTGDSDGQQYARSILGKL